jgi:hypothetical protein
MYDAGSVRSVEGIGDFDREHQDEFGLERTAGNLMLEGHAVKTFHRNEGTTLLLADVVNGADVRVVQGGSRLGFTLEPSESLLVVGELFWQKLKGNEAVQSDILGFVHYPHATAAELFHNAVVRNVLIDQEGSTRPGRWYILWMDRERVNERVCRYERQQG